MIMKPILLFNTEMVRAILDGRKTVTRRVVKPQPILYGVLEPRWNWHGIRAPYEVCDILYVRETWKQAVCDPAGGGYALTDLYLYKADEPIDTTGMLVEDKWCPSIHMPREAARIFLRVTNVRVERLQDINDENARKEGCVDREDLRRVWNDCYAKPRPIKGDNGIITHYESYPWEDIHETRIYKGKPWYVIGNPWVWCVEFEKISREEAYDV